MRLLKGTFLLRRGADSGWNEFPVEALLLVRGEQGSYAHVGADQNFTPLVLEGSSRFLDLGARAFHHLTDLIPLGWRQSQLVDHAFHRALARDPEQTVTVGEGASGKAYCEAGDQRDRNQQ